MKTLPKKVIILTAAAALSFAYPASVQAVPTTYQYTGNPFTDVSGPYTTSMFVTAMVTLAVPLAPNMPLTQVTPTAFTLSDGVQTLTNLNAPNPFFFFATDDAGTITGWRLRADVFPSQIIATRTTGSTPGDFAQFFDGIGRNGGTPGVWVTTGSVADTGSTLSLMTLTFMALGLVTQRFKRAAA
jgi:hypothetical protein